MSNTLRKHSFCLLAIIVASVLSMPANIFAANQDRASNKQRPRQQRGDQQQRSEEVLERIAQNDPEKADQLRKLRDENPEEFRKQMQKMFGQMRPEQDRRGQSSERGKQGPGRGNERSNMDDDRRSKGRGGQWKDRVQKRHNEFADWLKENYPKVADKLAKLREENPGEYMKKFAESREKYGEIMEAHKKNPEYAEVLKDDLKLKQNRAMLVRKLQNADDEQKDDLKAELKEVVAKRFDIIIKKKEFQYKALKKRLEELQKKLDSRQAELDKLVQSKDEAIDGRMKELIDESERLSWD